MLPKTFAALPTKWLLGLLVILVLGAGFHFVSVEEPVLYINNDVYLTRYASIVVPGGGVYGFAPGTKLTVNPTRHSLPDKVFVTDGTHEMAIEPDALTRDPDRARELAVSDHQGQAQASAAVAAEKAHVIAAERNAQFSRARDIDMLNAKQRIGQGAPLAPPTPVPTITPPVRSAPGLR